ncbi:Dual 3',5'-cyclic-AMP and -GMP phosphodiesterase 11 [Eumeta japonica]|uniref:Dual 3',5'-cyclic-AMP and-GMP phosphodiesterase 11 n=1 Tax=Eumeta variegata TaxID=151549 RepID=A0A4C1VCS7_EUMVA|nr:Dual 3',5'-cyclic-AMP and -GMP phosphodiesterase 11 [Eumeta japonica]
MNRSIFLCGNIARPSECACRRLTHVLPFIKRILRLCAFCRLENSYCEDNLEFDYGLCLVSKLFDVCSKSTPEQMEQLEEIRIPWGSGIVGYVAESGEPVNIPDAYKRAAVGRSPPEDAFERNITSARWTGEKKSNKCHGNTFYDRLLNNDSARGGGRGARPARLFIPRSGVIGSEVSGYSLGRRCGFLYRSDFRLPPDLYYG